MTYALQKICRVCGKGFGPEVMYCPTDHLELIQIHDEAQTLIGQIIDNRYRVDEIIGKGGFGYICKAYQATIDRNVALKVMRKDVGADNVMIGRFLREARLVAKLTDPNTVTIYDSGQTGDGLLYIAMELLDGHPLSEMINNKPMSRKTTVQIAAQICNSLAEAHEQGIIHRDIKPSNIFLIKKRGNKNFVKVLDFGIAKIMEGVASNSPKLSQTGILFGTPAYVSPEQAKSLENIDARTDIYSLGVMLYEMLTGRLPFFDENPMKLILKHLMMPPVPINKAYNDLGIPQQLDELVLQCLAKDPNKRPASALELKERLIEFAGGSKDIQTLSALSQKTLVGLTPQKSQASAQTILAVKQMVNPNQLIATAPTPAEVITVKNRSLKDSQEKRITDPIVQPAKSQATSKIIPFVIVGFILMLGALGISFLIINSPAEFESRLIPGLSPLLTKPLPQFDLPQEKIQKAAIPEVKKLVKKATMVENKKVPLVTPPNPALTKPTPQKKKRGDGEKIVDETELE